MSNLQKRTYKVLRKVVESETIMSFYLCPCDDGAADIFKPGQFLTLSLDVPGHEKKVIRNYSVSNWPINGDNRLRLSIKQEPSPPESEDIPAGLVSNFMHQQIAVGSILEAIVPSGQFFLNQSNNKPVVLLSGGVGITPMISMAHALALDAARQVYFIHACDSAKVQAFSQELSTLALAHSNIHQHICYRFVSNEDVLGVNYHSQGFLSKETIQSVLPLDVYEFYLCGPPPFMQAMYSNLLELGVSEDAINYEFFGPATLLKRKEPNVESNKAVVAIEPITDKQNSDSPTITFSDSDIDTVWSDEYENILEFAEANGIEANFSCRIGICNECKCALSAGEVTYNSAPLDYPEPGYFLPCCSKPSKNLVIKL